MCWRRPRRRLSGAVRKGGAAAAGMHAPVPVLGRAAPSTTWLERTYEVQQHPGQEEAGVDHKARRRAPRVCGRTGESRCHAQAPAAAASAPCASSSALTLGHHRVVLVKEVGEEEPARGRGGGRAARPVQQERVRRYTPASIEGCSRRPPAPLHPAGAPDVAAPEPGQAEEAGIVVEAGHAARLHRRHRLAVA